MLVPSDTRKPATNRWIRAALVAVALTCSASLIAQTDQKDKEQKKETPRPPRKAYTPPAQPPASSTPARANAPAVRTETQPDRSVRDTPRTNPPAVRSEAPRERPAVQQTPPPVQSDRPRPAVTAPQGNVPVRQPVNPTPANTPNSGRQIGNGGNPAPPNAQAPGRQAGNGGNSASPNTQTPGRQFGNGGNPASPNTPAPGRQFGNGGNPAANGNGVRNPGSGNANPPSGGRPVYRGPNGTEVRYRSNGQPQTVQARGMTITHTPTGVQRTVFERPDRTVIVTHGANHGYVQRPYVVNNVTFVQRTYYMGGRSYSRVYRPYVYHGISLNLYVTSRYYPPAYYGWVYAPWGSPVSYRWGWYGDPWYGYYGGYFTPYPTYTSAAFWLTDYILATTLERAYQERMDAAAQVNSAGYGSQMALTPEVKQAISDEVRRQLDQERSESQQMSQGQGGEPSFLTDNSSHVFVVANGMDVTSRWGECALTEGDVLQMTAPPPPGASSADLAVLASKGQDCRKGSMVSIAIADLSEMQNHMRETMDQGLSDLQQHQGQGGLPAPPQSAQRPPVDAPYAAAAPPPDPNIASELRQQAQTAQQTEGEVLQQAQQAPPAANSGPATVSLGMTIDQVVNLLGQPQVVADLGSKKTYAYGNMKVIFVDGKVTDVQ